MQHWKRQTRNEHPIRWNMDNYDGGTTWVEMGSLPDGRFRSNVNITQTQHREMMDRLLQWEIETNKSLEENIEKNQRRDEWKRIKSDVRWTFVEMYNRVGCTNKSITEMGLSIRTKRCDDPEELQDHESGNRCDNGHVETIHAIGHHKDDTHEFKQGGRNINVTTQLQKSQLISQNGGIGELSPGSNQHVDTNREAINHDATIHVGSDYGNTRTIPQRREGDNYTTTKTWCNKRQTYKIVKWICWYTEHDDNNQPEPANEIGQSTTARIAHNDATGHLCSLVRRGNKKKSRRNSKYDEDSDEDPEGEIEQMMCNMTGDKWEDLQFPVIIDSGACASMMPTIWCPHVEASSTPTSRAKEFFRAANGHKIYNEGQKMATMMTREGAKKDMRFTMCDVSKALGSVSQMCLTGHRVVFSPPWEPEGSYIQCKDIG